ncbi:hypothetical protein MRX96_050561 [Rhipicephalus microplus]
MSELRHSARGNREGCLDGNALADGGTKPGEDRKKTAAASTAYKKLGHKITEYSISSYLPRFPANDCKIIICLKSGLALTKVSKTRLSAGMRMQRKFLGIRDKKKEVLIVIEKQGTLIFSTPDLDNVIGLPILKARTTTSWRTSRYTRIAGAVWCAA